MEVGHISEISIIGQDEDMASYMSNDPADQFPEVFATPRMVALMEQAAAKMMKPLLQEGELSVGVGVNIMHLAATPNHTKITAKAVYQGKEGKLFRFKVSCHDPGGIVGKGEHTRAIIKADRIVASAQKRVDPKRFIYHFVRPDYWKQHEQETEYFPADYETEGFIHCCTKDQWEHVRTSYYKGVPIIKVLKLDTYKLTAALKYEGKSEEKFPHIYGGINKEAIAEIITIKQ